MKNLLKSVNVVVAFDPCQLKIKVGIAKVPKELTSFFELPLQI